MVRWRFAAAVLVLALPMAESARASEPSADRCCNGEYSLLHPLPDACLGIIDTDRPHQTDTPHVVPAGHMQFESALGELQLGGALDNRSERSAHVLVFDNNYKIGLVSNVDLQLIFVHASFDPANRSLLPPGPLELRAKFNVVEQRGAVPAITRDVQIDLGTYVGLHGDEPTATPFVGLSVRR